MITYFLEDDSLKVSEPREENSGLLQVPHSRPLPASGDAQILFDTMYLLVILESQLPPKIVNLLF